MHRLFLGFLLTGALASAADSPMTVPLASSVSVPEAIEDDAPSPRRIFLVEPADAMAKDAPAASLPAFLPTDLPRQPEVAAVETTAAGKITAGQAAAATDVPDADRPEPSSVPELASPYFPGPKSVCVLPAAVTTLPEESIDDTPSVIITAVGNNTEPEAPATSAKTPSAASAPGAPVQPTASAASATPTPGGQAPALGQAKGDPGALSLTLADAVLQSLSNNIELRSEKLLPLLSEDAIQVARAAFDPSLSLSAERKLYDHDHTSGAGGTSGSVSKSSSDSFSAGLTQFAPTGTTVSLDGSVDDSYNKTYAASRTSTQSWSGSAGVNISQSLLRGLGTAVNLVSIRQARIDLDISRYQLQNFTEALIVDVENTYWNLVLGKEEIEILQDSLRIARQQLEDTEWMITVGKLSGSDRYEPRATVAQRNVSLIQVNNSYEQYRLQMLWLLNPPGDNKWLSTLALDAMPEKPGIHLDPVEDHVRLALAKRPDINQARLRLRRGELTLIRTRNGLLPELDFTVNAGGGGGNYFNAAHAYFGNDNFTLSAGLNFNYDLGNRSARATYHSSQLNVQQLQLAMDNLEQQVQVEVRTAHMDVQRYQKQIEAATLAREFYAESLRAEQEKLKNGRSTVISVAIAQNNYMNSRLEEARAIISTIKSLTALYRYDGSLLSRRGVVLAGK